MANLRNSTRDESAGQASRRPALAGAWTAGRRRLGTSSASFPARARAGVVHGGQQGDRSRYSEFKQAVRSGQVAEVFVGDQAIRGTYKRETNGGRTFNTTRIEDPKLIEDLDAANVKYTGEMVSKWLPELLGWIVPLLLLFAVWSSFRRMSGAEGA